MVSKEKKPPSSRKESGVTHRILARADDTEANRTEKEKAARNKEGGFKPDVPKRLLCAARITPVFNIGKLHCRDGRWNHNRCGAWKWL
jgi:hypothetical protein